MENPIINSRYKILQQIGVGGFGLTYLAEDLHLQTRPRCVVKHLRPQITDAEALNLANRLFKQEAEILYLLGEHPNIPSLIAHFKERGEFYLVQEFIEGQTIDRELIGGKKFYQKDIVQFLGQTLEILSFVHSNKVIHRDIKPANLIRRSSDGSMFLIDFGAVKQVNAIPRTEKGATFSTITIGSHGYMPMEQMAGNPNFSSDLYALGLIVIEALTGIKPLDLPKSSATNEFVWSHKTQLAPELERFISKLVRLDFRQRFHSATEALNALNLIAANIGFFNRQLQNAGIATLQPIVSNQNVPVQQPQKTLQFIPPTIIVPAQSFTPHNGARNFQNNTANQPKSSPAKFIILGLVGIFVFIGFLFVAGKILNFRWSKYDLADRDSRPNSRQNELTSPNNSDLSLYNEAIKQAEEAQIKERTATTKFEWEEIANKYKRAFALLTTIDQTSPNYELAQVKIKEFQQKASLAEERALNPKNNQAINSNPSAARETPLTAPSSESVSSNKLVRAKLTMPPKLSTQNYLTYNSDTGYDVRSSVITSDSAVFRSSVEKNSFGAKDSEAVVIEAGGTRIRFKPPAYTAKLKAGSYSAVQEVSSQPMMNYSIALDRFYCNQNSNHSFTINSIVYDNFQNVSYFDATFNLSCENKKLMGRVHYDAR